ncbi:DHA2 family efflux MFS transporter permease subunit [Mangrovibacterium lignilyticum]|uniref:DHA2 family efflux MFS transporter permease subunit n=1 Tax=Mangrovibacterium lignilyticum TaxID=2668052 RepID=UPI001967D2C6|nr:DHA2 family efflux MFS transporter permease subunit [Mangrovibacterium lignilyticum]
MIGTFMSVLDATIVNVGLPKIMANFGASLDQIEWVLTAYLLSLAVVLPIAGWMADRFGYKRVYFTGLLLFTVGSALCGISDSEQTLIISRIVQGLGAGTIMPMGMAIVSREFPPKERGVALGLWAVAAASSVSFGPLIGGYLVDTFSWQLIFLVNVPVGLIGLFVTYLIQQEYKSPKVRKFDPWGFFSIVAFLPVTLYALSEGKAVGNSEGWTAPYILLCFAVALISLAVFIVAELHVKDPFIDIKLLKDWNFGLSNLIMFIFGIGMFGTPFILPLFLQNSLGWTAIQAGSVFLPVGVIQGMVAPLAGKLVTKINAKIVLLTGIACIVISFVMGYFLSYQTEHAAIMAMLYFRGLGMGILFAPLSTIALSEIPRDQMAQASSLFNVTRQLGGSFGVAILSSLLTTRTIYHQQVFGEQLAGNSPEFFGSLSRMSQHIVHAAGSSVSESMQQGKMLLVKHVMNQGYIQGISDDFLIAAAITVLAVIPVLALKTRKKDQAEVIGSSAE